jgi:phosphatidate cytidylyltransferase
VTRVLSGAVLLVIAVAVIWLSPPALFFAVAELLLILALGEYMALARANGLILPAIPAGIVALLTCAALARGGPAPIDVVLLSGVVALGALCLSAWRGGADALAVAAASLFPSLYLGLPIGAMTAVRDSRGREALFLLVLTVAASDTAQFYSGRAFGRRPLAPAISPHKTVEGALGGVVFGAIVLGAAGWWWLPSLPFVFRMALGVAIVGVGIAGDLFESMLKRSAGVKDSSALIPGHGGILDRIDALLFAAPVYYVVLRYV